MMKSSTSWDTDFSLSTGINLGKTNAISPRSAFAMVGSKTFFPYLRNASSEFVMQSTSIPKATWEKNALQTFWKKSQVSYGMVSNLFLLFKMSGSLTFRLYNETFFASPPQSIYDKNSSYHRRHRGVSLHFSRSKYVDLGKTIWNHHSKFQRHFNVAPCPPYFDQFSPISPSRQTEGRTTDLYKSNYFWILWGKHTRLVRAIELVIKFLSSSSVQTVRQIYLNRFTIGVYESKNMNLFNLPTQWCWLCIALKYLELQPFVLLQLVCP